MGELPLFQDLVVSPREEGSAMLATLTRLQQMVRPGNDSPLTRSEDRRLRAVERDPSTATWTDLQLLLVAHGVAGERLRHSLLAVDQLPVSPELCWRWTLAYDGVDFADLLAAGLTCYELVEHLERLTAPESLPRHVALAS